MQCRWMEQRGKLGDPVRCIRKNVAKLLAKLNLLQRNDGVRVRRIWIKVKSLFRYQVAPHIQVAFRNCHFVIISSKNDILWKKLIYIHFLSESFDNERTVGSVPLIPLPNPSSVNSETRRAKKYSPVQQVLYNAAALLAQIAAGFDIRKRSTNAQANRYVFM